MYERQIAFHMLSVIFERVDLYIKNVIKIPSE